MKIEGILEIMDSGRYGLYRNEEKIGYFTSGDRIKIFCNEEWKTGRVEHSEKYGGYYFLGKNEEVIQLKNGILARI